MLGHLRECDCSLTSHHPAAEPCACSVPFTGEKPNFPAARRTILQWFCYLVFWHFPYSPALDPPPGSPGAFVVTFILVTWEFLICLKFHPTSLSYGVAFYISALPH